MATFTNCWKGVAGVLLVITLFTILVEYSFMSRFVKAGPIGTMALVDEYVDSLGGNFTRDCPRTLNLTPVYLCQSNNSEPRDIYVSLFTTMTYRPQKLLAFARTLDVWPSLGPEVKPMLFLAPTDNNNSIDYSGNLEKLSAHACDRGWDVLVAPHCNNYNYPVLASMFRMVQNVHNTTWYGYANADILFTETLLPTLHFLHTQNATPVDFVVGKRTNIVLDQNQTIRTASDVTPLLNGKKQFRPDAEDYFIHRKDRFPWDKIPPFVVGRSGFDNWLLWYTYDKKIPAVDISSTTPVLHQSLVGVRSDHGSIKLNDHRYNQKLYGRVNFRVGLTSCTRYMTSYPNNYNTTHAPFVLMERIWAGKKPCKRSVKVKTKVLMQQTT